MHISTIWPDGTLIEARNWHELEEQVRVRQWHKFSVGQFRNEMRRRAEVWAGVRISIRSAEALFRGLENCGMVRIEVEDADAGID